MDSFLHFSLVLPWIFLLVCRGLLLLLLVSSRSFSEASKPEPMANPSGRLCSARPIPTANPVFNRLFRFLVSFFWTIMSQIIITIMPSVMPVMQVANSDIFSASGIRSKHTMDIISPDANERIKLRNFFDVFLNFTPIIPPQSCAKCAEE